MYNVIPRDICTNVKAVADGLPTHRNELHPYLVFTKVVIAEGDGADSTHYTCELACTIVVTNITINLLGMYTY